ncbi:MAG: reductase [Planctomycetota bacterium]|nr:reductase [Planctomycetota bacterium]
MSDTPASDPETRGLSASLGSKVQIAARGIASLFRRPPARSNYPGDSMNSMFDVISRDTTRDRRVPPGQVETRRWPVLHAGSTPKIDLANWTFTLSGLLETPKTLTWDSFRSLPSARVFADMHCVTRWSMLNNVWEGVLVSELRKTVTLRPEAKFVLIRAENGYTTNLPLPDFLDSDCLFAWAHNGEDLDPDHGWPLRLIVPRLYAWKSAKWVRGVEFLPEDRPGFWEENGYHNHGDPWREERFW